ncbi:MAG: late competence development ComFB family protein [Tissierella sp.]|uniref:late competence development ComFB family protein n=1 Tax=Tissierella sp. TaxID=41274 RepID=UPI003F981ECF
MLKNYMEIVVEDVLPDLIKEHKLKCDCQICIEDIKAITLNNLKPMYIVSHKGIVYSKLNELNNQFNADTVRGIMDAIKKVEENPRH